MRPVTSDPVEALLNNTWRPALAVTGFVAQNGIAGNWLWWNMAASGILTVFFFAALWRRSGVLTDDLEVYERVQRGLTAQAGDWVYVGRGHGGDADDAGPTRRGATGTSEIHIRSQFAAWLGYMTAE